MKTLYNIKAGFVLAAFLLLAVLSSCKKETGTVVPVDLSLSKNPLPMKGGSQFVNIQAEGLWVLTSADQWLTVVTPSGVGSTNSAIIKASENANDDDRETVLTLSSETGAKEFTLIQRGRVSEEIANVGWLELPATNVEDGLGLFTHYMTIDSKRIRNYTYYWDYGDLVARWVAYPLNQALRGNGSRSDEWGLDPLLPRSQQPVIINQAYGIGYARGHQIPSADRLYHDANVQTFYGTNMTPQEYNFNGGTWAKLEQQVRDWSFQCDTLYVVTGCLSKDAVRHGTDADGKLVAVPTHYFKALLAKPKTKGLGYSGYMGAGFLFENQEKYASNYTNSIDFKRWLSTVALSIDALEEATGIDFFVNLSKPLGQEQYAALEAELPSTQAWWW